MEENPVGWVNFFVNSFGMKLTSILIDTEVYMNMKSKVSTITIVTPISDGSNSNGRRDDVTIHAHHR